MIAKHCFTLGYINMIEENAQCKLQDVAMLWDFCSAVRSQQQPVATVAVASAARIVAKKQVFRKLRECVVDSENLFFFGISEKALLENEQTLAHWPREWPDEISH